jgi:RNA polymerase sigma-70 factor, ECF subfamily
MNEARAWEGDHVDSRTSTTLLEGLKDRANSQSWGYFVKRYRPIVLAFAKKRGLSTADAEDVSQKTMLDFYRRYLEGRYDRAKGRLRAWLFGIAHRNVLNMKRQRGRELAAVGGTKAGKLIANVESPDSAKDDWEREWERRVLRSCLEEVAKQLNPTTVRAFELRVLKRWPVKKVAEELGLTENAVYGAKHRALKRIEKIKDEME